MIEDTTTIIKLIDVARDTPPSINYDWRQVAAGKIYAEIEKLQDALDRAIELLEKENWCPHMSGHDVPGCNGKDDCEGDNLACWELYLMDCPFKFPKPPEERSELFQLACDITRKAAEQYKK
jgi:hypothetical protein